MTADGGHISPLLLDGEVPEGWVRKRLEEIASISGGTTPSRSKPSYWDGETAWATPTDLTARRDGQLSIRGTDERITDAALDNTSVRVLPPNSVLMTSRATIGEVAVNAVPMATNQGFCNFQPKDGLDSEFLAYWLSGNKQRLERLAGGSTFLELAKRDARKVRIHLPSLLEQKKIAAILSSVDDAIIATRKVIEQTKRVKEGLLQDLMTRGIGHTRFRQTEIGEIPEEWEVVDLEELFDLSSGKSRPELKDEGSVPVLGGNGVIGFAEEELISHPTVVIGRVGHYCGVVHTTSNPSWVTDNAMYVTEHSERVTLEFLPILLNHVDLDRARSQSSQPLVTQKRIGRLKGPVPPTEEQRQIVAQVASVDDMVHADQEVVETLQVLKRGLMQDLLTGRVRVPVD